MHYDPFERAQKELKLLGVEVQDEKALFEVRSAVTDALHGQSDVRWRAYSPALPEPTAELLSQVDGMISNYFVEKHDAGFRDPNGL